MIKGQSTKGMWDATCDKCDDHEEVEAESFREAVSTLRREYKWDIRQEGESWEHVCEGCVRQEKKDFTAAHA